jgi:hypothetical protein
MLRSCPDAGVPRRRWRAEALSLRAAGQAARPSPPPASSRGGSPLAAEPTFFGYTAAAGASEGQAAGSWDLGAWCPRPMDDEAVNFDDELLSYISDTDYAELQASCIEVRAGGGRAHLGALTPASHRWLISLARLHMSHCCLCMCDLDAAAGRQQP